MSITDPDYYRCDGIQLSLVASDWGLGYHLGLVLKYVCRAGRKDPDPRIDLLKAIAVVDLAYRAVDSGHHLFVPCPAKTNPIDVIKAWSLGGNRAKVIETLGISSITGQSKQAERSMLGFILQSLQEELIKSGGSHETNRD